MSPEKLTQILKNLDLGFAEVSNSMNKLTYLLRFTLKSGLYNCTINVDIDTQILMVYVDYPLTVPAPKISKLAVYLSYLNKNLALGCWELDPDTGLICYRTGFMYDETGSEFESMLVENLYTAINIMDESAPGILSVISSDASPREVIRIFTGRPDVSLN